MRKEIEATIDELRSRVAALEQSLTVLTKRAGGRQTSQISFPFDGAQGVGGVDEGDGASDAIFFLKRLLELEAGNLGKRHEVFIPTSRIILHYAAIFGRGIGDVQIVQWIKDHWKAGWMKSLRKGRDTRSSVRGFWFLDAARAGANTSNTANGE